MNGKVLYLTVLLASLAFPAWQWLGFELPSLKQPLMPPALPAAQVMDSEAQLTRILTKNLWAEDRGKIEAQGADISEVEQVKSTEWTLKGIGHQQNQAPVAVVMQESGVEMYHEGDVFPDGWILERVLAESIVIGKNGEERNVYLFKEK